MSDNPKPHCDCFGSIQLGSSEQRQVSANIQADNQHIIQDSTVLYGSTQLLAEIMLNRSVQKFIPEIP